MTLAKVVRKVSNKKLAKKGNKAGKIIAIVLSSVVLVVGAILGIYFGFYHEDSTTVESNDYFITLETTNGDEVEFVKGSYRGIENYIDDNNEFFKEYVIVFAYNPDTFNPYGDEENDVDANEQHLALMTKIADLQYEVNQAKARGVKIDLFIVDLTIGSNSEIASDSNFGAFYSDSIEPEAMEPMFALVEAGEYKAQVEINSKKLQVSTKEVSEMNSTTVQNAINYVKTLN
jgi:hypothetical protein